MKPGLSIVIFFFFKKIWSLKTNENSEFVVLELVGISGEQDNCETKFENLHRITYVFCCC